MRLNSSTPPSRERQRRPLIGLLNLWREHLGWPAAWGLAALALAGSLLAWTLRSRPDGSPAAAPTTATVAAAAKSARRATLPPLAPQVSAAGGTVDAAAPPPRSLALRQAQDLDRLLALAHRLGLATTAGMERSQLDDPTSITDSSASQPAGSERWLRWRVELRLSGLPVALDAFVAALAQELPHARIDRIAWPPGGPASGPAKVAEAAELSLSLRYPGVTE